MDFGTTMFVGTLSQKIQTSLENGVLVGRFSICIVKRGGSSGIDTPNFFTMEVTGRTAENMLKYTVKGQRLSIICEPCQEKFVDDSGKRRSRVKFRVITVDFGLRPAGKRDDPVGNDIGDMQKSFAMQEGDYE